jgi:hypothetical protein
VITRKEAIQCCDGLKNTAGQFRDAYQRTFEFWVLTALRIIIHILLGNVDAPPEERKP